MVNKKPQNTKKFDRKVFRRQAEKLRRINWKMCFLLFSFGGYGMIFYPLEGALQAFLELLILIPAVFMLEKFLNGKSFCCPLCGEPFNLTKAALVIASGKCPACASVILDFPPQEIPVFNRSEFIAYHRKDRSRFKLEIIVIVLSVVILGIALLFAIPEIVYIFPDLRCFFRVVDALNLKCFPLTVFALFMLAYLANRMHWRPARCFERCPHCNGSLDGDFPRIAIATGRCGYCGEVLLTETQPLPDETIYRLTLTNGFAPEFHWFTQGLLAVALILSSLQPELGNVAAGWGIILSFDFLLLLIFQIRWPWQPQCRHHRNSRLIKVSGHCGVCGKDLTGNAELFRKLAPGERLLRLRDSGVWRGAVIFSICLMVGWLEIKGIPNLLQQKNIGDVIGLILANLFCLLIPLGIGYFLLRQKNENGIVIHGETLTVVGERDISVRKDELKEQETSEVVEHENRGAISHTWRFRTETNCIVIQEKTFADKEYGRLFMAGYLFSAPNKPDETGNHTNRRSFQETNFTFDSHENPQPQEKICKTIKISLLGLLALACIAASGVYWEIYWLWLFCAILAMPFLLAYNLGFLARSQYLVLRKYKGLTLLPEGLRLEGHKPKLLLKKKIYKVVFSHEKKDAEDVLIASFYIKPVRGMSAFILRSDWFAEPEKFIQTMERWRAELFLEHNASALVKGRSREWIIKNFIKTP